ncbi:MAG: Anaerobic dimethyl sulfoxide reductase chain B [Syntrophorhabdaceae bacterium PtaU1.Bin034]|nr:MAG: Anaerobic dimethyl sulfoxide reductase chain B [Syntrophorhabdaceae bacterium PtaU1.Bin034]
MRRQLGLYVNQQYCTGCKTCQIACKDKHDNEVGVNFLRVTEHSGGGFTEAGGTCQADAWAYWIPVACNHCDIPRCVEACPTGAIRKSRVDGTMSIDQESCSGCGACLDSCPYGAPAVQREEGKGPHLRPLRRLSGRGQRPGLRRRLSDEGHRVGPDRRAEKGASGGNNRVARPTRPRNHRTEHHLYTPPPRSASPEALYTRRSSRNSDGAPLLVTSRWSRARVQAT